MQEAEHIRVVGQPDVLEQHDGAVEPSLEFKASTTDDMKRNDGITDQEQGGWYDSRDLKTKQVRGQAHR